MPDYTNNPYFGQKSFFHAFVPWTTAPGIAKRAATGARHGVLGQARGITTLGSAARFAGEGIVEGAQAIGWAGTEISGALSGIRGYTRRKWEVRARRKRIVAGDKWYTMGHATNFFHRSGPQHLKMGIYRGIESLNPLAPFGRAAFFGSALGAMMSTAEEDMLSLSETGFARNFASMGAGALGFVAGGAVGAALGVLGGPLGALVGYIGGGMAGASLAEGGVGSAWKLASLGKMSSKFQMKHANSVLGSERATTQRARALQLVYNSGMSARSILGNEGAVMHM